MVFSLVENSPGGDESEYVLGDPSGEPGERHHPHSPNHQRVGKVSAEGRATEQNLKAQQKRPTQPERLIRVTRQVNQIPLREGFKGYVKINVLLLYVTRPVVLKFARK